MEAHLRELVDYGVLGSLVFLSFVVFVLVIERCLFFRAVTLGLNQEGSRSWIGIRLFRGSPLSYERRGELEIDLSKYLTAISTIGSNSPYIGLLGTVFGIMLTFLEIGKGGVMDSGVVMTGLGLALQATALGIGVAIPSIAAYNFLVRRSEVLLAQWDMLHET